MIEAFRPLGSHSYAGSVDPNDYVYFAPVGYSFEYPDIGIVNGIVVNFPVLNYSYFYGEDFYSFETISCTGTPVPASHIADSKKLEADAYVELFEITLVDRVTKIYLKLNKTGDWQGHTYEGTGIKLEGVGTYADDQVARPRLSVLNPEGIFTSLVDKGLLENGSVTRIRVLKEDYANNIAIFRRQKWRISRVASVKRPVIILELRDMLDGQAFQLPGRMFIPPDFPTVSLS